MSTWWTLVLLGSTALLGCASEPPVSPDAPPVEPTAQSPRGRSPRRLRVDQLHAALLEATGAVWRAPRFVIDPTSPTGDRIDPEADMLEQLAGTLGRPDYAIGTREDLSASAVFAKVAGDAARATCRRGVEEDAGRLPAERRLLRHVEPTDTAAGRPDAVRQNLAYLLLRFWGRVVGPDDPEIDPLFELFARASAASTEEGWRVVCVALATDPQFLTY